MKRIAYPFAIAALALFLASPTPAQSGKVMKGTWTWSCCKDGVYSGSMDLVEYNDPKYPEYNFNGHFNGAGGGSVVGKIEANKVTFIRESDACSSGGKTQTWIGTIEFSKELGWVIKGTLSGCNDKTDENIKADNKFVMSRK